MFPTTHQHLYLVRHLVEDIDMLYSGIDLHKHAVRRFQLGGACGRSASLGLSVQLVGDPEAGKADTHDGEDS